MGGVNGAIAVTYDAKQDRVYWTATDEGEEGIAYKAGVTSDTKRKNKEEGIKYLVKSSDIHLPEGIAIDYLARNIYFTDSHADTDGKSYVGVASLESGNWTKLITNARFLHKPRGVAVHSPSRLLFYTDWGRSAGVYRANTDGTGVRAIVNSDDGWINDLAVDTVTRRLYWVDAHSDRIESVNFDGGDRRIILDSMAKHPFYLETFEGYLYWTDWRTSEIHFCDKVDGSNMGSLYEDPDSVPMGISVHHSLLERTDDEFNACSQSDCSFLCVLAPEGYACVCPEPSEGSCVARTVKVDPATSTEAQDVTQDPLDGIIDPSPSSDVHSGLPVLIIIGILAAALVVAFFLWHRVRSRREARSEATMSFEPMRYSPQASVQTHAATVNTCMENESMEPATTVQPHFYYCNGEEEAEEEERGDQTLLIANPDRNFYQNT